jgi:hypothetical protein
MTARESRRRVYLPALPRSPRIALALLGLAMGCAGTSQGDGLLAGAGPSVVMNVDNQARLLPSCADSHTLTFFEGTSSKDLPYGQVTPVTVANLWGTYKIGFQVNGWYWRCGGALDCPNLGGCQNPDNAGQVGIIVTPGSGGTGCTSATLDARWTLGLCDAQVPSARTVVTVTLEDPAACRVKVVASGLDAVAPSPDCCDCNTCTSPPGNQKTHCRPP